jgi:hypothetical protein
LRQNNINKGSRDKDVKVLIVMPSFLPSDEIVVITVTPVASWRIHFLNDSIELISMVKLNQRCMITRNM